MRNRLSGNAMARIGRFLRQADGQDLMEYGLLVSLIATLLVGTLSAMGATIDGMWSTIVNGIQY